MQILCLLTENRYLEMPKNLDLYKLKQEKCTFLKKVTQKFGGMEKKH